MKEIVTDYPFQLSERNNTKRRRIQNTCLIVWMAENYYKIQEIFGVERLNVAKLQV
jgi:hypothetical protein